MANLFSGLQIAEIGGIFALALAMLMAFFRPDVITSGLFKKDRLGYVLMVVGVLMIAAGLYLRGYELTGLLLGVGGYLLVWGWIISLSEDRTKQVLSFRNVGWLLILIGLYVFVVNVVLRVWPGLVTAWDALKPYILTWSLAYWILITAVLLLVGIAITRGRLSATRNPRI